MLIIIPKALASLIKLNNFGPKSIINSTGNLNTMITKAIMSNSKIMEGK